MDKPFVLQARRRSTTRRLA